ncbi:efflux RND transporter periplasmic adaptor subunit [Bacillus safensis]|uniref:efflux RND transporter periplasmic adaptor subunit n=1 Tax=Bacillus TaxID=1386 RepID=UPI0007386BDA|nr:MULTISPECIES: efflux RND transporter periplasmic adaptor subunit [Bacillus]MBW4848632.1 efflux RND transporter periplasmic adaptor subunit [Bacillaceae bacterium]KUF25822.1 efflux permease [Bacillus sp. G1(2015b)]MBW4851374.1 efflux RND transporter periplasmic adaptor subunit [Bacillaceae bacterium]MBW4858283.1 efflux RND transporter periplasmic adaptor subunit [Bacillaceae bacterium]MCM3137816.1 efflux RND transporter periplasmic adaptor subunit [Bacillus safensis]
MRKKIIIGSILIIVIGLFIGFNIAKNQAKPASTAAIKTVKLTPKEITSTVMTPGTLSFFEEQFIYEEEEKGKLKEIAVKEGEKVKAGTPLLTYENKELELEEQQQALAVESSTLNLEQLQNRLSELEEKKAGANIKSERDQLQLELKAAELEQKQAEISQEKVKAQIEDLTVHSKIDGTVISIEQEAGAGGAEERQPIIHIGHDKKMIVRGLISEYDAIKIKKKQKVKVTSDVIRGKSWQGVVKKVGTVPVQTAVETTSSDQTVQYPVEVEIKGKKPEAKPGFKMIMEIQTDKRQAQTIPETAVKKETDGQYVYVVEKNELKKVKVVIGETSGHDLEVTKGVKAEDQIIAHPTDDMYDGMEVNAE